MQNLSSKADHLLLTKATNRLQEQSSNIAETKTTKPSLSLMFGKFPWTKNENKMRRIIINVVKRRYGGFQLNGTISHKST